MKYMLIMQFPLGEWKTSRMSIWPEKDIKAQIAFLQQFNQELVASGELVATNGLAGPEEAKIVRAQGGGAPAITDGPFPESKEFLAGYVIVDVDSPKRAYEIAARWSSGPGPGGAPLDVPIEVRPVMSPPSHDV
jgi:hypothetical protein